MSYQSYFHVEIAAMSSPSTQPSSSYMFSIIRTSIIRYFRVRNASAATTFQRSVQLHTKDHWTQYEYVVHCWNASLKRDSCLEQLLQHCSRIAIL